jgi:hypothetical protein
MFKFAVDKYNNLIQETFLINNCTAFQSYSNRMVKNDAKGRNSPPRFNKGRRKHNSGGNKKALANKIRREDESKFHTVSKSSSEIGSSNNGTILSILRRSPTNTTTANGDNSVSKPTPTSTTSSNLSCPPLIANSGASPPAGFDLTTADQFLLDGKSYAGSRFHTPPRPDLLPKPPTHWIGCNLAVAQSFKTSAGGLGFNQSLMNMHLKGLLKVQV